MTATSTFTIRKIVLDTLTFRSGADPKRRVIWMVERDGRDLESFRTRRDAERCIRLLSA